MAPWAMPTPIPGMEHYQVPGITFFEKLLLDRDIRITLQGGYDSGFGVISGFTALDGVLTIVRGGLTVDRLVVK